MIEIVKANRAGLVVLRIYAALLILIGAMLVLGGGQLLSLGGSPYYVLAGIATIGSAVLLWRRDRRGAWLYSAMLVATIVWALWESGFDPWALAPRVIAPAVLGVWLLLPWSRRAYGARPVPLPLAVAGLVLVVAPLVFAAWSSRPDGVDAAYSAPAPAAPTEWRSWGNSQGGTRYAGIDQLTPFNVAHLEPAWSFETGAAPRPGGAGALAFETVPLKVGNTLYFCSPHNVIFAIDAISGERRWRFDPQTNDQGSAFANCRGVAYHHAPDAPPEQPCADRLFTATIDARLIAIDARTGLRCVGFGRNGEIDLREGISDASVVLYFVTSTPVVSGGVVVTGSYGFDGQKMNQGSGVVRAYDLVTGAPAWAFDPAAPDRGAPLPPGQIYAPGTPNVWSVASTDEALGLVYLPFGVATPDYFGGFRSPGAERFSNAIVAVDNKTGKPRWSFQTVHHDLWDYDIAAQPVLTSFRVGGRDVPALISVSKTGETFVLDRATGKPLMPIVERGVPQGAMPEDHTSPTQPFSPNMPNFAGPTLDETKMWGLTPLDQLWCRIAFRKMRYDGRFTPPRTDTSLQAPGMAGGVNWGSVAIDEGRRVMIVNSSIMPNHNTLLPASAVKAMGMVPMGAPGVKPTIERFRLGVPQTGAPYGARTQMFLSPLQVPCTQPPFGLLSAVDLTSHKLLWSKPIGLADRMGPMGFASRLPFTIGLPTLGGSLTTRGGLTFIASTPDSRLRAYETVTGRLLWQTLLPANANATPMTYVGADGRQYVVIAAGGSAALASNARNVLVAYALPMRKAAPSDQ